jgi:hypothetical protein
MASYLATYNKAMLRTKFEASGRAPHETGAIFDAKSLKAAHKFFRAHALEHYGVVLDDADYSLRERNVRPGEIGFLDNPNPPRVLEKPGRCGTAE